MSAALHLVKVVDKLILLQRIEKATGKWYGTDQDARNVRQAVNLYSGRVHGNARVVR